VSAGTTTISGAYTLTGSGGNTATVSVAATRTLTATSTVANAASAVTGAGTIAGPLTLNTGSTIAPGAGVATLTTAAETWNGGAIYAWDVTTNVNTGTPGVDWDLLQLNAAALTVGANGATPFNLQITRSGAALGPILGGTWFTIAHAGSATGVLDANFLASDNLGNLWQIQSVSDGGTGVNIQAAPVPEPTAAGLLAAGFIGLLARRRRRARS
jgi:hypothetical protein